MKKFLSALTGLAVSAALFLSFALTAFAKEDVEIDVSAAEEASDWGQTFELTADVFSPLRMSADSQVKIEFETDADYEKAPVELIILSWDNTDSPNADDDGGLWVKVAPLDFGDGEAVFDFDDMAEAYGTKDFKQIKSILIGDTGITSVKLTKMTITNCIAEEDLDGENSLKSVEIDCKDAKESKNWGQSIMVEYTDFDTTRMTSKSQIIVDYEIDKKDVDQAPCELVFQSWENPDTPMADEDGNVWAKIAPAEFTDTQAVFDYIDIIEAYGTANFEKVSAICIGDAGFCKLKCTGITVTNCTDNGTHKVDAAQNSSEERQEESSEASEAVSSAAETEAQQANTNAGSDSGSGNVIFIIIGVVSGIVLAVGVVVIIMNKKSGAAYDVNSGKFVSKKKSKK
ncbi:hypothetical protein [Ruminococcus sp. Marseille-P6503]|uniref:hypothetical protein n=1 Tax=Ruminococcus sp. Marseille-P6503 TaxID=2364796 RepID=UPI000F51E49E|nr:hypothetical protein [Ruminococcus sp. Marseille-P6503]